MMAAAAAWVTVVAFVAAVAYLLGRRDARMAAATEARNRADAAKERVKDAVENSHAGGGAWIDRLRASRK